MTIRVVQWATGSIGRVCLRHVIDDPKLELVGVKVHSAGKAGRDAGDLVRRPPTGVLATTSIEDVLALDADVVLHVPINGESPDEHVDDLCRLLRSGKNVITTVGFTYPRSVDPARAARLEQAAREGESTLFGTGINPGLIAERMAVTATSICTDVEHVLIQEIYDCTPVASEAFIFGLTGFGQGEAEFWAASAGRVTFFQSLFGEVLGYLTDALALPVEGVESSHAVSVTPVDLTVAAGVIGRDGPGRPLAVERGHGRRHVAGDDQDDLAGRAAAARLGGQRRVDRRDRGGAAGPDEHRGAGPNRPPREVQGHSVRRRRPGGPGDRRGVRRAARDPGAAALRRVPGELTGSRVLRAVGSGGRPDPTFRGQRAVADSTSSLTPRRTTLPVALRGSSSTKITRRGHL